VLVGFLRVAYALKTPYRDGTTHVVLEPKDFVARLAALVPGPRSHLTRYHGVFAPHAKWRALIVPGQPQVPTPDRSPAERQRAMTQGAAAGAGVQDRRHPV
jgi:hypothetical protein